jgi:hypothetical protein
MRKFSTLLVVLIGFSLPVYAQNGQYLENGRHNGPYGGNGNPYNQNGGGIAPIYRTDTGQQPALIPPQRPPALPSQPTWATQQPDNGHSLQFQQYQESQPTQQLQPSPPVLPPEQQHYTYNPEPPAQTPESEKVATAGRTLKEIEEILQFEPSMPGKHLDYLTWYLNGAYVDPSQFLKTDADWLEGAFRHFFADYLVAFWNVTMQDAALRILMPLVLVAMIVKVVPMLMDRLLTAETH